MCVIEVGTGTRNALVTIQSTYIFKFRDFSQELHKIFVAKYIGIVSSTL